MCSPILGGMVLDVMAHPAAGSRLQPGTTVPGTVRQTPGGVARNVAEAFWALAPLGLAPPLLISAVASDPGGDALLAHWRGLGLDARGIRLCDPAAGATPSVAVLFDARGEVAAAVADVSLVERAVDAAWLARFQGEIRAAPLVVADANLSHEALGYLSRLTAAAGVSVWFENASAPKSGRGAALLPHPCLLISPNAAELASFAAALRQDGAQPPSQAEAKPKPEPGEDHADSEASLLGEAGECLDAGVSFVVLHLGKDGAVLCSSAASCGGYGVGGGSIAAGGHAQGREFVRLPALPASELVNCSGAGDCLAAGSIAALAEARSRDVDRYRSRAAGGSGSSAVPRPVDCPFRPDAVLKALAQGMAAARAAVESSRNVPDFGSRREQLKRDAQHILELAHHVQCHRGM